MKKKVFSLMMTLLLAFIGVAKADVVTIGDGTSTTYVTPFNSLWGYSFVEQVYTADEIGTAGTINAISFNMSSTDAQTNQVDVFMKNVSRTTFSGTSDYETVTASDMVFSGTVTFNNGWTTITLDTPFQYDGTSNLMIGMHEYTSGYSTRYFYYTSATDKVVTFHNDSADPNPYNLGSYSGSSYTSANRANIQIDITPGGGDTPVASDIYDFEDSTMQGWTAIDADGDGYNWVLGSQVGGVYLVDGASLAGSGNNASNDLVCSGSYTNVTSDALYPDNYLVSPQVTLGGSISFYACAQDADYAAEHFGVFVSTTGTNPSDFTMVNEWTIGSRTAGLSETVRGNRAQSTWTEYNADLSAYSGQGYVAIRHFNCSDMFILDIDDIAITEPSSATAGNFFDFEDNQVPAEWSNDANYPWTVTSSTSYSGFNGTYYLRSSNSGVASSTSTISATVTYVRDGSISFLGGCWGEGSSTAWDKCIFSIDGAQQFANGALDNWSTYNYNVAAGQHTFTWTYSKDSSVNPTGDFFGIDDVMFDGVATDGEQGPDYEVVDAIEINGFVAPAWGVAPVDNTFIPEDANYTLVSSGWYTYYPSRGETREQGRLIEPDPNFTEMDGRAYYMYFYVTANEGYGFTNNTVAYLNGDANMWHEDSYIEEYDAVLYTIDLFPADAYEAGLHTYAMYGVGENAYENIDRLLIERPNGAWMEPYHFNLYNDGDEDVEVVLIDFLHNNGYFSMDEETTEYPFTVAANGRPGVDLYINTDFDWTDTEEINSLLAVNTTERSTHLYQIVAAPYTPYCPDVVETAYPLGNVTEGIQWRHYTSWMWNQINPQPEYEIHDNYTLPFPEIPEGRDAVIKFTVDRAMSLNARVPAEYPDGKVALYTEDFYGQPGPMANNNYTERPMQGGGSTPAGGAFEAVIGNEASTSTFAYVPFRSWFYNSIGETLYTAAELQAAGVGRAPMTSLSWYASSVASNPTAHGIQIWMANVSDAALTTTSHLTSGMTKVFAGDHQTVQGWNEFQFNQGNFAWDGTSNVLICVLRNDTQCPNGTEWKAETNISFNASAYAYSDGTVYNTTTSTYSLSTSTTRSIIKMKGGNNRDNVVFSDDFETVGSDNALPAGWTTIDADGDGNGWYALNTENIPGHSGYGHVHFRFMAWRTSLS